jgi:hypothetical protein
LRAAAAIWRAIFAIACLSPRAYRIWMICVTGPEEIGPETAEATDGLELIVAGCGA